MAEPANKQERNHRSIMRQSVQAPEATAVTRCIASSDTPAAFAFSTKVEPRTSNAMLMPPDAEPVMPDKNETDAATDINGLRSPIPMTT